MTNKHDIRTTYKEKRGSLTKEEVDRLSADIINSLINNFDLKNKRVHLFIPIKKFNEVNLTPLIDFLIENESEVATSITLSEKNELQHVLIDHHTELEEDSWGIPTPVKAEQIPEETIDVVIVPLLAFDEKGHRVGYGKGYYDRFLSTVSAIKIGVSLFESLSELIDIDHNDVALDIVVTPSKVHKFDEK